MNLETLEALGITKKDLINRVVEQCVEALLYNKDFDEDGNPHLCISHFQSEIEQKIKKTVDDKIVEIANVHVLPKIGEMIENANFQETNGFGEAKGPRKTFIEYIAARADNYMLEKVDSRGMSKSECERVYDWRDAGSRITVIMQLYIKEVLERAARDSLKDINSTMVKAIRQSALDAVASVAKDFKISL